MKFNATLKGILIGMIISLIVPFLMMNILQGVMGGITNYFGESWLYIALFIPCTCAFGYLGYYLSMKNNLLNKQRWKITIVLVLIVSLFGGTIGTIIGETIVRGGMETISIQTTVLSGIFYSFVFLPITLPLGKFIVDILYQWVHQLPWGSMNT